MEPACALDELNSAEYADALDRGDIGQCELDDHDQWLVWIHRYPKPDGSGESELVCDDCAESAGYSVDARLPEEL